MKMKMTVLLFLWIMTCCKKDNNSNPLISQQILFQADYINYAWTYQHYGWLIDSSGNVRSYKLPKKWNFADSDGYISAVDMNDNFQQLDTIVYKINKDTLQKYFNKLISAASGELTKPESEMFDAGSTLFSGYIYDLKSGKYKEILIRQIGDVFIENKSIEANQIYNWMIGINSKR